MPGFSSRTPCPANLFEPFFVFFGTGCIRPRAVCRPSVLHDGPPRQYPAARKNLPAIAGRSGIKASGLPDISGGLVYPFEIVDVHLVGRAAVHKIAVGACCTRNNQLIVFARFCFFIIVVDFQFRFDHAVAFGRLIDE